jgi:predicted lipid-binding transport protein (Tim44 family)
MKAWCSAVLAALILTLTLAVSHAEAARLGGGRSLGAQRSITQRVPQPPPQAAPQAPVQPAAAPSLWTRLLGGMAVGVGLGWLLGHGMGGLAPVLMLGVLALIGFALMRALTRPRLPAAGYMRSGYLRYTPAPVNYSGLGNETVAAPPPSQLPGGDAWEHEPRADEPYTAGLPSPQVPPGFDAAGFLKQAKLNFIRLQDANDRGDTEALRDVTTDTLFDALAADLRARSAAQHTDVVTLDATLLEVVTENDAHWASVKFAGLIREHAGAAPTPFAEVWHLSKPIDGRTGWLIAGIEQIS